MSDVKEIKHKANILAISAILAKGLTIGKDGAAVLSEEAISQTLPEGLTEETVKAVFNYRDDLFVGSLHALSDPAVKALAKDKKLEAVTLEFKLANDTLSHGIERERLTGMPGGEKKPTYGYTTSKYEVQGANKGRGELKKVHTHIKNLAADAALG